MYQSLPPSNGSQYLLNYQLNHLINYLTAETVHLKSFPFSRKQNPELLNMKVAACMVSGDLMKAKDYNQLYKCIHRFKEVWNTITI